MLYSDVLKEIRAKSGMTQKEFAEYFATPLKTLIHWENRENRVPENFLRLLAYKLALDSNQKDFTQADIALYEKMIDNASPKKSEDE